MERGGSAAGVDVWRREVARHLDARPAPSLRTHPVDARAVTVVTNSGSSLESGHTGSFRPLAAQV